jgi:hypothetical protein
MGVMRTDVTPLMSPGEHPAAFSQLQQLNCALLTAGDDIVFLQKQLPVYVSVISHTAQSRALLPELAL